MVGLFSMPEQGKKSEFVQTGQLKNILAEVMKEKNKAKSTALKHRQKTIEYLGSESWMSQIARNVFVLPNTDFPNRLVRGQPLIPQKLVHENLARKFSVSIVIKKLKEGRL